MLEQYRNELVTEMIDGINYTSTKFDCSRALELKSRTTLILGENGLAAFVNANKKTIGTVFPKFVKQVPTGVLFHAATQTAAGILADPTLPKDLLSQTKASMFRPSGKGGSITPSVYEHHFRGELPHLVRVLGFVLLHNYAGFTLGPLLQSGSPTNVKTPEEPSSSSKIQSEAPNP